MTTKIKKSYDNPQDTKFMEEVFHDMVDNGIYEANTDLVMDSGAVIHFTIKLVAYTTEDGVYHEKGASNEV